MKKTTTVIKKWQLLKWRSHEELADLSEEDFVAVGKRVFYRSRALEEARMPANAAAKITIAKIITKSIFLRGCAFDIGFDTDLRSSC